ncbi:MAG TPA: DUF4276 family protein [Polyangiaceae bacterium]
MRITILVEGKTEKAFSQHLRTFLEQRGIKGKMPKLDFFPYDGRIPREERLARDVEKLLQKSDAVIGLSDLYTGTNEFEDAADAKRKMSQWARNSSFFPHVAAHEFEAWLLPFWSEIKQLAHHNASAPPGPPETVNHNKPPSKWISDIFEAGKCRDSYAKVRDAKRILEGKDLARAAAVCPELKSFLNRILELSGALELP